MLNNIKNPLAGSIRFELQSQGKKLWILRPPTSTSWILEPRPKVLISSFIIFFWTKFGKFRPQCSAERAPMRNCCSSLLLWWLQLTLLNQRKYIYIANGYYQFLVEKKSWKKLFCFVVDKNRLFLVKCASVISSVKQKKKWKKKTKEIFVTFHLWFEIWSR